MTEPRRYRLTLSTMDGEVLDVWILTTDPDDDDPDVDALARHPADAREIWNAISRAIGE